MRLLFLILITSLSLIGCTGVEMNQSIENTEERVKDFMDRYTHAETPGIQYIVVNAEKALFKYAGGWGDIRNQKEMTSQTTMLGYSMTKTFTAVAVLQLVESGELELDDKVISYLPDIPYGDKITVRQLINHTSGIPNPIPLKWIHLATQHNAFDEQAELNAVLESHSDLSFDPGTKYAYSNIGYWLLGKIVEKVTQQTFRDYVKKNILIPLGLAPHEMDFMIHNTSNHSNGYLAKFSFMNLVKGFVTDDKLWGGYEGKWLKVKAHYLNGPAFGGLVGSSYAFSRFIKDQLGEKSVLLTARGKQLLYGQEKNIKGDLIKMTLGWHVGDVQGIKYFFKEGGGAGYHCEMRVYPGKGIGSVIIVNKTMFNSNKFLNRIDKEFLGL